MVEEQVLQKQHEIELRANGETRYFWPDSIEFYNSAGERTSANYYDKENRKRYSAYLSNGSWELDDDSYDSDGFALSYQKVRFYEEDGSQYFAYPSVRPAWWWYTAREQNYKFNTVYDKDNLILVELISDNPLNGTYNYIEFHIKYNENNNPDLIEEYNYGRLIRITRYEYNADGYMTLLEKQWNTDGKLEIIDGYPRETAEFDEQGRPVEMRMYRGSESANGWLLDSYWLFYYSDGNVSNGKVETLTPAVYISQDIMYIQTVQSETVTVYSIMGQTLYETAIQPEMNTIPVSHLPQGILIVRGSSGWVSKVVNR